MDKNDIDWALHEIQQMVIIAPRSTQGLTASKDIAYLLMPVGTHESLEFSLGDILDKVVALKEDWDTEPLATVAPKLGSGGQRPEAKGKPEIDWSDLYRGMEGPLCEAVHMTQIADGLADHVDHNDSDSREQLAFAVNHSRQLLEDLRRRYYERERTED
jgi:hypothetical protein